MYKTPTLQLPIYDDPNNDKFYLADWNTANQNIEDAIAEAMQVNANVEVANARGGYPTLDDRLDGIDTTVEAKLNAKEYNVMDLGITNDDTLGAENSTLLNAFLEANKTVPLTLYFPVGTFRFYTPITLYPKHNFRGAGTIGTQIKYVGSGNAMQLPTGTDGNYEYTYLDTYYEDFTLRGVGSSYGLGATANGIYLGDETQSKLFNTPLMRFNRLRVLGFKYGIYIEGYGHTFQDTYITNNERGLLLVHPEQVMCSNVWIEYAKVGLYINPLSKVSRNYGHYMTFIGGAVQRNEIGLKALNFYGLTYKTYCEGNTITDVILGDPDNPTYYTNGVCDAMIDINIDGDYSDNCVKVIASQSCNIKVMNYGGAVSQKLDSPLIYINGYAKNNTVQLYADFIKATTPVDIRGDAVKSTTLILDGTPIYYRGGGTTVDKVLGTDLTTVLNRYLEYSNSSTHIVNEMGNNYSFGVKLTGGSNSCFDVLDSANNKMFSINNTYNAKLTKHLIIPDNKGIVLYSPNGSKYLVTVSDTGTLSVAPTSISY